MEMSDYVNSSEKRRDRKRTTETPQSGRNVYRLAVLTLGLLCLLQATLNISLRLIFYENASSNNLTEERDQLQASNNNLTEERDQLQASNNSLTEERDQLKKEIEVLNQIIRKRAERACPPEWRAFGCNCYYASTEQKTWEKSRQDCLSRGALLVVINSREEQIFLNKYGAGSWFWIGLSDKEREGTWTWVDGSPLTTMHWASGQPDSNAGRDQDCVAFWPNDQLGSWSDLSCFSEFNWICEK